MNKLCEDGMVSEFYDQLLEFQERLWIFSLKPLFLHKIYWPKSSGKFGNFWLLKSLDFACF